MALVQTHILRLPDLFVTVAPHSLSSYIDNHSSRFRLKRQLCSFGAFLTISSVDVPSIISDLDRLIYRCKKEFLGSQCEIYGTADTYLPLIH